MGNEVEILLGTVITTSNFLSGEVTVIDGSTNEIVDRIAGIPLANGITFDSANGNLFVVANAIVTVIDGSTDKKIGNIGVNGPIRSFVGITTDNNLYVTDASGTVHVIDASNFNQVARNMH